MSNISIIASISFSMDKLNFTSVNFVFQSASYQVRDLQNAQGNYFEHSLVFKIAQITPASEALLRKLKRSKLIRFTDVNGFVVTLVKKTRFVFDINKSITGTSGSFRGYEITVKHTAIEQ